MLRALRHRDFRLLMAGMVVSNIGSWMQMVAMGWLVLVLTNSPFYVGLVGFFRAVPVILLSPLGGVVADRVDRRRLLFFTQSTALALAFALGYLSATRLVTVEAVFLIALLMAAAMTFDNPARQAMVADIVGKEELMNAIGLNSASFNAAAVVGPAIAGGVIALWGVDMCFYLNAASFLAVLLALVFVRPRAVMPAQASMWRHLVEGLSYMGSNSAIVALIGVTAVVSFLGRPYIQLMPVFARDVLGVGAVGLGLLTSTSGLGALLGALVAASLGDFKRRGALLLVSVTSLSLGLVLFAASRSYAASLLILVLVGGSSTLYMAITNTLLQTAVPASMRGRMISVYSLVAMGFMPLGSALLGGVGSLVGVPLAVGAGGLLIALSAALVALAVPALRDMA